MERARSLACPDCPADARCEVCGLADTVRTVRKASRVVAASAAMQALLRRASHFAAASAPIVILGESGSGKEVVARVIHASSARADKPFVAVNVAALPAELLESELFGHVRGAFTGATTAHRGLFEAAEGGTLFLDEIAEMPLALQVKMLRALQDGEIRRLGETQPFGVDVRVMCATHRDLEDHVARGSFREDLYYRLNVLTLRVPPLRERRDDILPLARRLLEDEGAGACTLTKAAEGALVAYAWPGNVRQLSNAIRHGAALASNGVIDVEHLPDDVLSGTSRRATNSEPRPSAFATLAQVEREHVLRVLEACGGSQTEAAKILGIGRNTLWRKLRAAG